LSLNKKAPPRAFWKSIMQIERTIKRPALDYFGGKWNLAPYLHATRSNGGARYRHEMTEKQHVELLAPLNGIRGNALVCGYASELYDDMLVGWRRVTRNHRAASGAGARPRIEVLRIKREAA
jgi:site-specific DNA-adenine methylase